MQFSGTVSIHAPRERVWAFMLDIPSVARCVPGVVSVSPSENDSYIGALKVKVGPIGATLEGRVIVGVRGLDAEPWRTQAVECGGPGQAGFHDRQHDGQRTDRGGCQRALGD